MFRASRYARPYRRFRRYGKKRLGLSFVQKGSKVRYGTKPNLTYPFSKKRAASAAFGNNISQDEWKELGMQPQQSMTTSSAPLSMVRFKDPASNVFEYHHFVRRIDAGSFQLTGATNAEASFNLNSTATGLISDFASLATIFNRYRITRLVWQFIPCITTWDEVSTTGRPLVLSFVNRRSDYTNSAPSSFADALDDCTSVIQNGGTPFSVDYNPMAAATEDLIDAVPVSHAVENGQPSPWIDTAIANISHIGGSVWAKVSSNGGAAGSVSQTWRVYVTTYFDMDNIK